MSKKKCRQLRLLEQSCAPTTVYPLSTRNLPDRQNGHAHRTSQLGSRTGAEVHYPSGAKETLRFHRRTPTRSALPAAGIKVTVVDRYPCAATGLAGTATELAEPSPGSPAIRLERLHLHRARPRRAASAPPQPRRSGARPRRAGRYGHPRRAAPLPAAAGPRPPAGAARRRSPPTGACSLPQRTGPVGCTCRARPRHGLFEVPHRCRLRYPARTASTCCDQPRAAAPGTGCSRTARAGGAALSGPAAGAVSLARARQPPSLPAAGASRVAQQPTPRPSSAPDRPDGDRRLPQAKARSTTGVTGHRVLCQAYGR